MPHFDEEQQDKKIENLLDAEEENLISMLADSRYGIGYVDLSSQLSTTMRSVSSLKTKRRILMWDRTNSSEKNYT